MTAMRLFVTYVAIPCTCILAFEWQAWRYLPLISAILISIDIDRRAGTKT
jgi:hypothetical protein